MKFYGDRSDAEKLLEIYQTMRRNKVPFDLRAYTVLIHALICASSDIRASRAILDEMQKEHLEPSVVTYSVLIDALAKAGNLREARELFELMKVRGIKPDRVAYDILIQGYVRMGHGPEGRQLYEEMLLSKIQPKVGTYIAISPFLTPT
ncbi:hypothetical protein K493DRAFT_313419 [Basidiobolus meristosporus CBS 931.73]|uniref:Pentacotripeptide-repeat region of PRORP domain-containing protein n=1 Tax=Basidiobolus meristosporus CBS 931.73 TaxID=1314790 RepID=A0A1Y1YLW5_9FUNG|nr:hypothetical protein K493DRAFT_313419 [Basidiobolus meristosporus CBS 931.73]|eukprot:ORX99009.1 hypothetical protein K493DRAFT_313419 [Basidiobolus meristosporus CBS 931.73]